MQGKVEICGINTARLEILKNDEMMELLRRTKQGDMAARERLIRGNLRLVLSVIQRFSGRGESMDDLFQVGVIGLIKAIDHFNTELNVKFSTYAVPMCVGEVRRFLRDDNPVRVSRSMRDTAYKAMQVKEQLMAANGREPTVDEIAAKLGMKTADVVLPQGASLEVNNEIKGMNKQRFTNALQKEGYDNVRFYNPDGALGFRPDDSYFADKKITVSRLRNWSIEDLSSLDASEAVTHSRDIGFDNVQLVKDDKERWALYIKPEGKEGFAVYPDKGDLNHFFTTLKQSMDNIERVREELAQKYYAMAEAKPDLKVDIFGGNEQEVDLNRIQRVAVFRAKSGECLCAATIDGKKLQPRSVSPSQWQRLWVAPDRDSYKQNLAASLFADVLQKDNNVEQSTQEKQEEATEVKQAETAIVDKHDEQKEVVLKEDKSSEQREEKKQEEKKEEKKDEKAVKAAVSPLVQQYLDLKKKHPDAILLFRCGDFYETYKDDAVKASKILGITLTKSNGRKDDEGKPLAMAGFPYHALDTYLPKLIRAGERVAICDQLEMPKQTTSSKRGITEMVSPGKETGKQMAQESQETEQHTSLRR